MPAMPSGTTPTTPPRGFSGVGRSWRRLFKDLRSACTNQRDWMRYRMPGTHIMGGAPAVYCSMPAIQREKSAHKIAPKFRTPWGQARGMTGNSNSALSTPGFPKSRISGSCLSTIIVMVK